MNHHRHDFTYKSLQRCLIIIGISKLLLLLLFFLLFLFVVVQIIVCIVLTFDDVLLIEFVLFTVDAFLMLFQVPLPSKLLVAELALNFLLHAALVVHVTKHDTSGRIPFATFEALVVLAVLSL